MFLCVEGKTAYEVLKRCKDLLPEWKEEGHRFWNSRTGEIITEKGTEMQDLVYRGHKNYNNYWKDCYSDKSESFNGASDLSVTLNNSQNLVSYISQENNNTLQYKGKDMLTGYYVYGPLFEDGEGNSYIDDIEAGCVKVYPETVELDTVESPTETTINRTAGSSSSPEDRLINSKGNVYGN